MPHFVKAFIVFTLKLTVLLWRNDNFHPLGSSKSNNYIRIIPSISQQCSRFKTVYQFDSFLAIVRCTFCDSKSDWHTIRIHRKVNFGVEPPFVRSIS